MSGSKTRKVFDRKAMWHVYLHNTSVPYIPLQTLFRTIYCKKIYQHNSCSCYDTFYISVSAAVAKESIAIYQPIAACCFFDRGQLIQLSWPRFPLYQIYLAPQYNTLLSVNQHCFGSTYFCEEDFCLMKTV
jgi:hypothetical protein